MIRLAAILALLQVFVLSPDSGPRQLDSKAIENFFQIAPRVFSGGTPESREAFAELSRRGVTTIISVDGSKPEVEKAREFGLRYIHIPIGYDGISATNKLRLVRAAQISSGAVYLHCHHGKHRGPAAAAIICLANEAWTRERANEWMKLAGTSPDYPGLFQSVREFEMPKPDVLTRVDTNFPERVEVSALIDGMVEMDLRWEHLLRARKAGYRPPADHPDLVPSKETVLLAELYREMQRLPEGKGYGEKFMARLAEAEKGMWELREVLGSGAELSAEARARADQLMDKAAQACSDCHKEYRNRRFSTGAAAQ
jgi:hypothetical protein